VPQYTDPQSGRTIRSNEPLSDADLEEAFGSTQPTDWMSRAKAAGSYAFGKGKELLGAAGRIGETTGLSGGIGQQEPIGQFGHDVLTVGATGLAPELALAGTATGAGTTFLGGDQGTADLVNAVTQGLGGLGMAGYQGIQAVRQGPGVLRALAKAGYQNVEDYAAAKGLRLAPYTEEAQTLAGKLTRGLERYAKGSAEKQASKRLIGELQPAPLPAGGMVGGMNEALLGGGPTYESLDRAYQTLQGLRRTSGTRAAIDEAMKGMLGPMGGARTAAQQTFAASKVPLLRNTTGGLIRAYGTVNAARDLMQGNWRGAAENAAIAGLGPYAFHNLTGAGMRTLAAGAAPGLLKGMVGAAGAAPSWQQDVANAPQPDVAKPPESPAEPSQVPETAPGPSQALQAAPGRWGREIAAVSSLAKIPPELVQAVMHRESGGKADALGDQGQSHGLMQIKPGTFAGVAGDVAHLTQQRPDLDNPFHNLLGGALLLRRYLDMTKGDVGKSLMMYNGGEGVSAGNPQAGGYSHDVTQDFLSRVGG